MRIATAAVVVACSAATSVPEPFELKLSEIAPATGTLSIEQRPRVSAAHAAESKASADGLCTGARCGTPASCSGHARARPPAAPTCCRRGALHAALSTSGRDRHCRARGGGERRLRARRPHRPASVVPLLEANAAANAVVAKYPVKSACRCAGRTNRSRRRRRARPVRFDRRRRRAYAARRRAALNALRRLATPGVPTSSSPRRSPRPSRWHFPRQCAPHFELHVVPAADQPEARRSPEVLPAAEARVPEEATARAGLRFDNKPIIV